MTSSHNSINQHYGVEDNDSVPIIMSKVKTFGRTMYPLFIAWNLCWRKCKIPRDSWILYRWIPSTVRDVPKYWDWQWRGQALKSEWAQGGWGTESPLGDERSRDGAPADTNNLQPSNAFLRRFVVESVLHLLPLPLPQKETSDLRESHDPTWPGQGGTRGYATGDWCDTEWSFQLAFRFHCVCIASEVVTDVTEHFLRCGSEETAFLCVPLHQPLNVERIISNRSVVKLYMAIATRLDAWMPWFL